MRTRQLRTIVLAVISLAIAAALFLAYQYRETQTAPIVIGGPSPTPAPAPPTAAPSRPNGAGITLGANREVEVPGGGEMRCEIYDHDGNSRGRLVAAEWRPLGDSGHKLEVVTPRIRISTPGGQIIDLRGSRGVIERRSANLARLEIRNAELQGDVHITIDRLTHAQRKALADITTSGASSVADEAGRYIELEMDDLFFDLEFARVETAGPFHVRSAEAEIQGRGLSVRYNELESRVEELNVSEGERIVVWNLDDRFRVSEMSAAPPGESAPPPPTITPPPTPTPTPVPAADNADLPPLLAEDEPRRPRERPTDVYTAVFENAVRVQEYQGDTPAGRLSADYLRLLFDFSQREREMARQAPVADDVNSPADQPAKPSAAKVPTGRIELTWSGPLKINSERLPPLPEGQAPRPQRVHLTATGDRVEVDDGGRHVECRKLVYRNESEAVELTGTAEFPAYVRLEDGGELSGREIMLDRAARRASARGPGGRLVAAGQRGESSIAGLSAGDGANSDVPFEVLFEDEVVAGFDVRSVDRFDPRTGESQAVEREMLRSAVFTGQVRMTRGDEQFRGQRVEIDFDLDSNGKQYPTAVRAFDEVVAAQGPRYISARESLHLDFELLELPRQKAPFNLSLARKAAADRGDDPDTIDWAAVETHYSAQRDYSPGLRRLKAVGDAEVRDPRQQLEIDCELLECRFRNGREIQSGLVTPRADGRAFVALGTFSISAPTPIPFDAVAQTATVEGAGRMTFPSRQDIDGRMLDEPLIVGIQWTERMAFNGGRNEAIFRGGVRTETERSGFQCASLRIDFVDAAPADGVALAANARSAEDWWVLQPIIDRTKGGEEPQRISFTGPNVEKKPVYIYAAGDVSGQTANHDAQHSLKSRVHFTGPILAVDLRQRQMHIDGGGTLLIEDYRKAGAARGPDENRAASQETSPFGRTLGGEASQTFLAWQKSMSYHDAQSLAEFEGNVRLEHSTGAKMKHAAEILGQAEADRGRGREASLICQKLSVQFARDDAPAVENAGTSPMSGTEVDAFIAEGQVHFADSGISAIAQRITYARDTGALEIFGSEGAPAELFDQRNRFSSFKGPRFTWNRKTNQILAPNSSGRIN